MIEMKGIATDLSGVLLRDEFPNVVQNYERVYNLKEGSLQIAKNENWPQFATDQIDYKEFWRRTFDRVGINLSYKEIDTINSKVINSQTPLEAFYFVDKLKSKYEVVGVITNTPKEWFEAWDKLYQISRKYHPIIASYKVRMFKSDKQMFLKFCEEARLPPWEILYFDDQESRVDVARSVGMQAEQVLFGENPFLKLI